MSYAAAGQLGLTLISGLSQRAQQKAQNSVYEAEAQAANVIRAGQNVEKAGRNNLANWMTQENNKRRLVEAGAVLTATAQTLARQREVGTAESLEAQLSEAEAQGALAANVALSGASGASVDVLDMATALKRQRADLYRTRALGYADYDLRQRLLGIIPQAGASLDTGTTLEGLDYGRNTSRGQRVQGNWLADLGAFALSKPDSFSQLTGSVSSFFKTPKGLGLPTDGSTVSRP